MNKRNFIKNSAIVGSGILLSRNKVFASKMAEKPMGLVFTLPKLPYAYNALEPFIDAQTMEIHHSKHHQAYITNLNKALESVTDTDGLTLELICKNISKYPTVIRNNGGGHFNHTFFWTLLGINENKKPIGKLADAINNSFGSLDKFKEEFAKSAMGRFGSGWAWLIVTPQKELKIVSTPNQDNPLMDVAEVKGTPILALDVWEHAYYLKYQNKRADYINAFWNVVNWAQVESSFEKV
jgi:Fe-Mn family superoxide dismutase